MSFIAPSLFDKADSRGWPFGALEPQAYSLIMADPPWRFELYNEATGAEKSAQKHYECMPIADICALPVGDLARADSLLWLWATWPMLKEAMQALEAWGFRYVTGGAWDKQRWGGGYVLRSVCEPFLIGKIGSPIVNGRSAPNLIAEKAREHSRKPECCYAQAESMVRGRRCELFSRTNRSGWESWGNEVGKFDVSRVPSHLNLMDADP